MEPLPASQDALRLELRLAAGARNDADADGDGLSLPLPSISLSYTLVHRCRPRAVVDLFRFLLLLIISSVPCSFFSKDVPIRRSKLLARFSRRYTWYKMRIHRKIRILRKHLREINREWILLFRETFRLEIGKDTFEIEYLSSTDHVPSRITYSVTI